MIRVSKWQVDGKPRNGARPVMLFLLPNRSVRVVYADRSGVRKTCWSCAMRELGLSIVAGPWTMLAPDSFAS